MRLRRLIGVAVVGILAANCSDATAPPKKLNRLYVLESIGGQPVPSTFSPNQFATVTVFWSTINLDPAGNATIAERRRRNSQPERTSAWILDYHVTGETIDIGNPCGPDVLGDCYPHRYGQINDSTLTLTGEADEPVTLKYVYRLALSN